MASDDASALDATVRSDDDLDLHFPSHVHAPREIRIHGGDSCLYFALALFRGALLGKCRRPGENRCRHAGKNDPHPFRTYHRPSDRERNPCKEGQVRCQVRDMLVAHRGCVNERGKQLERSALRAKRKGEPRHVCCASRLRPLGFQGIWSQAETLLDWAAMVNSAPSVSVRLTQIEIAR